MSQRRTARAERARDLGEMWNRVSRQHVAAGAGCSCAMGGLFLQASDFELDIVEFLINDARKEGRGQLDTFIEAVSARGPDRYSLVALLDAIARAEQPQTPSDDDLDFALERLNLTLSSMDAAHSRNRFVCD